eukprot:10592482-Heterocapsa_arctica.AAC.1
MAPLAGARSGHVWQPAASRGSAGTGAYPGRIAARQAFLESEMATNNVVHGCYRMLCTLIPDNALYIFLRAAVSSVLPRRTIDVFPLASAFVFARRHGRSGFAFIIARV